MSSTAPSYGRPRDPEVDSRIIDAAIATFGEVGWAGFTLDAVAKRAGVGKASIYLRWSTKNELLRAAFDGAMFDIADIDTGTVRGDLIELASQLLDLYLGERGKATVRLSLDARAAAEVRPRQQEMSKTQIRAARGIVRRGIARGELPESTSVTLLLDTLCGGAIMHATSTPEDRRTDVRRGAQRYAEDLVDFLLKSLTVR